MAEPAGGSEMKPTLTNPAICIAKIVPPMQRYGVFDVATDVHFGKLEAGSVRCRPALSISFSQLLDRLVDQFPARHRGHAPEHFAPAAIGRDRERDVLRLGGRRLEPNLGEPPPSFTVWITTGTVIRKMMRSTSITSTSGVVLMSDMGSVFTAPAQRSSPLRAYPILQSSSRRSRRGTAQSGECAVPSYSGSLSARRGAGRRGRSGLGGSSLGGVPDGRGRPEAR